MQNLNYQPFVLISWHARKHYFRDKLSDEDVLCAYRKFVRLKNSEKRDSIFGAGEDTKARLLEIAYLEDDNYNVIIHAAKCRKQYSEEYYKIRKL